MKLSHDVQLLVTNVIKLMQEKEGCQIFFKLSSFPYEQQLQSVHWKKNYSESVADISNLLLFERVFSLPLMITHSEDNGKNL